jgi:uncharacterized protein
MKNTNPLVFLLAQLAEGQNSFELEADPDELGLSEYTFSAPLRCEIGIQRIRDRIDVHLDLETAVKLSCSRCGEPMRYEIQTSVDVTFLPELRRRETEDEQDATDLEFYREEIDLRGVVRDTFLLAVPIAVLCRKDCKGLCPSCGTNLNLSSCECEKKGASSPFEKLRRIVDG